jgi:hypothetical protein
MNTTFYVWSGAFTATVYTKIFSGYQPRQVVKTRRRRFYVKPGLVSCVEYAIQSEIWAKQGEFLTPPTSPLWLARSHEHGAWAGIYMTRLGISTTSEPWGRGQRWTSKHWSLRCFNHLTRLVAREDFIIQNFSWKAWREETVLKT